MSYPFAPARFSPAELLSDAWADACRNADNRAFYVREDAARLARLEADRFASIDGLAQARASKAHHVAQYLTAVRRASKVTEQMQAQGVAFDDGSKKVGKLSTLSDEAEALANMQAVLAALDAANDAGQPAPTHLLVAMRGCFQVGGR